MKWNSVLVVASHLFGKGRSEPIGVKTQLTELDIHPIEVATKGSLFPCALRGCIMERSFSSDTQLVESHLRSTMPRFDFLIRCTLVGLKVGAWLLMGTLAHADEPSVAEQFEQQLAPILQAKCGMCHSNRAQEAELDLSTFSGVLRGGESGSLLDAEHPEKSLLWTQIESGEMPPDDHEPLNTEELDTIKQWVLAAEWAEAVSVEKLDQHDVLPFLLLRCARCHGQQVQRGNLDVRSKAALLKGGESGPAIVAGEPDESLILKRIHAEEMPPREDLARYSVKPMEPQEVELLTRWIAADAPEFEQTPDIASRQQDPLVQDEDRSFWAFRPAQRPRVPVDRDPLIESSATTNAIDAFIQRRLRDANLRPSPRAAPATLIRRAYFDLHGLPPSREAVRSFEEDFRARGDVAFVEVIDRLLASPRYAERWADYWLDLAGYSDSEGVQHSDPVRPHVWRYRDYVIRSFADDKPYDQFLREQVAGDELADYESADEITQELSDNLVATAFLKLAPDGTFAGITGFVPDRLEAIDDSLEVLSSAVMGLTIRCARCHSHKFDPIPQRDYYRLSAVFKGALDEHAWLQPILQNDLPGVGVRRLPFVPTAERKAWESHEAEIDRQLEALKSEGASEEQIKQVESKRRPEPMVRALWDNGDPSPTYLLRRGNYLLPDRLIGPGVPSVLTDGVTPFEITQPWPNSDKSGRRLAFANWLVQPDHPLTARVMANRIWRHHFGIGIVSTLDDFGKAGSGATHPDLLDWLSIEFVRRGWSVKQMHRLI